MRTKRARLGRQSPAGPSEDRTAHKPYYLAAQGTTKRARVQRLALGDASTP